MKLELELSSLPISVSPPESVAYRNWHSKIGTSYRERKL
jgi:hypothetical protein